MVVAKKISGRYSELTTVGVSSDESVIEQLVNKGKEWIDREQEWRHPRLDLFGEERIRCEQELVNAEQLLSNITIDGADLILDMVFDNVGFNRVEDEIFRKLVKACLSYPASKSATVGYIANRARKDAYNHEKGIRRLEKAYRRGILTKEHINKCGCNKFLSMDGDVKVSIDLRQT